MIRTAAVLMALAALLAGCGEGTEPAADTASTDSSPSASQQATPAATATSPAAASAARAARGTKLKAVDSQFGTILADGRGQAVYVFDKESSSRPRCYGACATAWPPVLTKADPRAGKGVRDGRLGTTERRNGARQVTIDGQPLYYYIDDSPGQVLCHNVVEYGGLWLVVRPGGKPVS